MRRGIATYEAYLEKWRREHPNVILPQTFVLSPHQEVPKEIEPFWKEGVGEILTHSCKYWNDFGRVVMMPSGKVYEEVQKRGPARTLVAVFPNKALWTAYDTPMTIRQYLDQW